MILKLVLFTASLFGAIVAEYSACHNTARPSGCQRNNSNYANETTVYPTSTVNCSFAGSLCCYRQGCFDDGMDQWQAMNGHASVGQHSGGCGRNSYSVLESPLVNLSTPSCVQFAYSRAQPYQLQVFLAFRNGTQPSMIEDFQSDYNKNHSARVDIENLTGKIQFRVLGGGGPPLSGPRLYYVSITEGRCPGPPSHPEPSDPPTCDLVTTTPSPTLQHTTSSTTTPLTSPSKDASTSSQSTVTSIFSSTSSLQESFASRSSASSSPLPSQQPAASGSSVSSSPQSSVTDGINYVFPGKSTERTFGDRDSGSNVGVIIGASVAAVAAVVVFVIVVIIYRRKVHARKPDGRKKRNLAGISTPAGAANPALGPDDPYELAEDGAPGKTRNSLTDDYTYIGTGESSHQTQHQADGSLDDDYSCIGDTQNIATAGVQGKNTTSAKPDPRDVYNVVNKPGKKTPTPVYSLAKMDGDKPALPNPNDVYSVVNKKVKKPDLAPKPGHSDTEYNTISHKPNDNSSQKAAGDATSDTYNRIGGVASLGSKGQSQESALAEKGSLVDEYNTLDFADTRQNAPRKENSGAARAAYDHVRNDPDDPYSKTQIGKRNVVIGSDYDHVKP